LSDRTKRIDARTLKAQLHDGGEIALLDAREEGPFSRRHLLLASCVPLSRLELLVDDLVREAAARVATQCAIPRIDKATLERWRTEAARRTLYVLDVRTPEEYEAGHLRGARSAPGGQLVQETDAHVATLVRGSCLSTITACARR
jgi:rhodanese-related sulfurtransferase